MPLFPDTTSSQFWVSIAGTLACYVFIHLAKVLYGELTSPLRDLPGPSAATPLLGHFKQINDDPTLTSKWHGEFGSNFQLRGLLNKRELYTADTKALNHIMMNDYLYQKGPVERKIINDLLGNGLLAVEMDDHKRQRKILNPAFGVPQIRELTGIFIQKSVQLRDIWTRQIEDDSGSSRLDVFAGLRKMTLDVIGEAGFNYEFNALEPKAQPNELVQVLHNVFHSGQSKQQAAFRFVQASIPILSIFPTPVGRMVQKAHRKMVKIGNQLLADSKAALKTEGDEATSGRDLLSIMVKANTSDDIPEHQRLSDADVIAQIPTFFIAAHDTTSAGTAWALHALSVNQTLQKKLREELLNIPTDNPTMDQLNSLPYLERVVRETMRVRAPAPFTFRMAMADDVLPLAKPYTDRKGKLHSSIRIPKGTMIRLALGAVNLDKEIWGADAAEFRPERWEHIPEAANAVPGVWANLSTFLAGPHHCIGFRFAIVEMKALLFTLIRAFEFHAAVGEDEIIVGSGSIQRPKVRSELGKGPQLPLIARPYGSC
ncbi:cytochrome P450 [Mycena epipterygia]|nr:cytochrome P450 [Mycena epipterygia]